MKNIDLFSKIVGEIEHLNTLEQKPHEFKIIKFNEEFGELCAEIIKKSKYSNKPFSKDALLGEIADCYQVLTSLTLDITSDLDITMDDVLNKVSSKNEKWLKTIEQIKEKETENANRTRDKFSKEFLDILEKLMKKYPYTIDWSGKNTRIRFNSCMNKKDCVIVYENGVRGPADYFYINTDGKLAHGGYTGYKDTYDCKEFEKKVEKTHELNYKHDSEYAIQYDKYVNGLTEPVKNNSDIFIDSLIYKYSCVSRGGDSCPFFACEGHNLNSVVVFRKGVKGPAEWFYLNDKNRFAHGGYGYKETYNFEEFEKYVEKIEKHNNSW